VEELDRAVAAAARVYDEHVTRFPWDQAGAHFEAQLELERQLEGVDVPPTTRVDFCGQVFFLNAPGPIATRGYALSESGERVSAR
jgi:hypothetical protein